MKELIAKKEKGFYSSVAALMCTVLGLVFFLFLAATWPEELENPTLIVILSFAALALDAVVCFKDYYKIPSIAAYAVTTVLFVLFLGGRVSYLAFYFSGDVMNTGLSVYMILAAACYFAALIAALLAVVFKQEKKDRAAFTGKDVKVLAPVVLIAVILCVGTVALRSGGPGTDNNGPGSSISNENPGKAQGYKAPTTSEEVWQEYTNMDYFNEDETAKAIAYQLTGQTEIDLGDPDPVPYYALLNLYEDGQVGLTTIGRGILHTYYGYWTNEEDHLWFCVAYYGVQGTAGLYTIDYSYDLTGHFDEVTLNISLGLANGGQFVREIPISGNGEVVYPSVRDFLLEKGWEESPDGYKPIAGEIPEPEPEPAPAGSEVLFSFASDSENFLLDCNSDGTYTFTFVTAGLVENGEWSWKDWIFTLTDTNGTVTTAEMDGETHALSLHFVAAVDARVNWDFTCDATTWGTAFSGEGNYEPISASDESTVLFSFASDSKNFLLDCNSDGTYTFTFVTVGLVETGDWSWQNWIFTLTDANGKVTTAEMDDESHTLSLHFVAAVDERVNWDFTCDPATWGAALGTTGNYTAG